jgi:two-component system OmpR family response regulator
MADSANGGRAMRVLVVEDEPRMADVLRRGLTEDGCAVDVAGTAEDGAWYAAENPYDAIVLDVGLPGQDGFDLLAGLRQAGQWAPVIMLTARDAVPDRVRGLDLGADDYLTKPFAFTELLARLRATARRGRTARPVVLRCGGLALDPAQREVRRDGTAVDLTAKEFAILECFMRRPGQVLSRSQLIEQVWDFGFSADSNLVDVYVASLRRKIDRPFGTSSLETVRGVGYRLREPASADDGQGAPA